MFLIDTSLVALAKLSPRCDALVYVYFPARTVPNVPLPQRSCVSRCNDYAWGSTNSMDVDMNLTNR